MAEAAPNSDANANASPPPAEPAGGDLSVSMPESWRAAAGRPTGPTDRVALIENSLRCLTYGWLTLVPVAGAFFVIPAVRLFQRVDRERAEWNPAAHLWLRGLVLASFGFWVSLLWWWLLACWLGSLSGIIQSDGPAFFLLLLLIIFGSAAALLGMGLAATRWPNRFGAFVQRRCRELLGLMLLAYAVVLPLVVWNASESRQAMQLNLHLGLPDEAFYYGPLAMVWLAVLLGALAWLAWRGAKSRWWFVLIAGAAFLSLWVAAN